MERNVRPAAHARRRWKRKRCARRGAAGPVSVSGAQKTQAAFAGCLLSGIGNVLLCGWLMMNRRLLGRSCWRCRLQQLALLHGHHERAWCVRDRLALKVQTGAFLGDQLQWNLLFKRESNV